MNVISQQLQGVSLITNPLFRDPRGVFSDIWKSDAFAEIAPFVPEQLCFSHNDHPHTLRGLHYQEEPQAQAKLISCIQGRAYDVVLDLRPESPTYLQWQAEELTPFSGKAFFIPKGCAHGFLTLEPATTILYLIEGVYSPSLGNTARWDDPVFDIKWPATDPILSDKDRHAPDFSST